MLQLVVCDLEVLGAMGWVSLKCKLVMLSFVGSFDIGVSGCGEASCLLVLL